MGTQKMAFFFDGTGNGPRGKNPPSNVYKMYDAFKHCEDDSLLSYYFPGPGATEYDVFAGQVSGSGIIDNIKNAYRMLVKDYESPCKIALFGFSRGGYTVHMFAWLLAKCGISQNLGDCDAIVDRFIENPQSPNVGAFSTTPSPIIDFIGVWDIVKSVIPDNDYMDGTLPLSVEKAFHAMALDELRRFFPVMKWQDNGKTQLDQEWFAGVHSDIGGGYPSHGLSDIAYKWMQEAVIASGVVSDLMLPNDFKECPDQKLNNPFAEDPRWIVLGQCARKYEEEKVHPSVLKRHALVADYTPEASGWHWA